MKAETLATAWGLTADEIAHWHSRAGLDGFASLAVETTTPARYAFEETLGQGGMGQVFRVWDRETRRHVAMKVLHPGLAESDDSIRRFVAEAQAMASLGHAGVVPVYARGRLPDGRPFFTMAEVTGASLEACIATWPRRRLVEAWLRVARTVAHAHTEGLVHRDLKPANVMIGEHETVLVLDWGLVKHVGGDDGAPEADGLTRVGAISGTPAYMAPEQAAGRSAEAGAEADVYALGSMLFEFLAGEPPYAGSVEATAAGERKPCPADLPLRELIARTLEVEPSARPTAAEAADEVEAWLNREARRQEALARLGTIDVDDLRARRAAIEAEERSVGSETAALSSWLPVEQKRPTWRREDALAARQEGLRALRRELVTKARAALELIPELPEAHSALAELHREAAEAAECAGDARELRRRIAALRRHDRSGHHTAWADGVGALTLITDPPCEVELRRFEMVDGSLRDLPVRSLGRTPLTAVELPMGSYLLILRAEGCDEVRYPVFIRRLQHWDGVPPGASAPLPIRLPRPGELGPDEVYVPAGWCQLGGDYDHDVPSPHRRVWLDPYAIDRTHVTFERYLGVLNRLVEVGDEVTVQALQPRNNYNSKSEFDLTTVVRDEAGRFGLGAETLLGPIRPRWPVCKVTYFSAVAFAAHVGRRLPTEDEWEKAVRGADRREYPWGDRLDPSLAGFDPGAHYNAGGLQDAGSISTDRSLYGVHDLAGLMTDWCELSIGDGLTESERGETRVACRGGAMSVIPAFGAAGRRRVTNGRVSIRIVGFRTARDLFR